MGSIGQNKTKLVYFEHLLEAYITDIFVTERAGVVVPFVKCSVEEVVGEADLGPAAAALDLVPGPQTVVHWGPGGRGGMCCLGGCGGHGSVCGHDGSLVGTSPL